MPSSKIPSPARSQGAKSTPRQYKPRASRSVGSPARSSSSVKLSTVIQMNSFVLSPMPSRRSVLTDTTDIDIPRRKSWWKKLDENSREIMEVLNNKDAAAANNALEEYIEVDVLSQENNNFTVDIPESSDGESIGSIVIPQRNLFTQKESKPQKKFAHIIDDRESLAPLHNTQKDDDKALHVNRKNLFSRSKKQRSKPLFPSALLNISANKTIANKTKELAVTDAKREVKSLFGNRPGAKRKNMFADFIVSDNEDEIPEIQPIVFGFQKKSEHKRRRSVNPRGGRELISPTSSITDIEMDDWRLLPSSTMMDHQLEDGLRITPSKRARLEKLPEATESLNTETNRSRNKTKHSHKSLHSKSKSINLSQHKKMEMNGLIDPKTNIKQSDTVAENSKSTVKNMSYERSLRERPFQSREHSKSKNSSHRKTSNDAAFEAVNIFEEKNAETSKNNDSKGSNTLSKIDQVFQSDDDEDISLVYENDANDEAENEGDRLKMDGKAEKSKSVNENVQMSKQMQDISKLQNITHEASEIHDNVTNTNNNNRNDLERSTHNLSNNGNQRVPSKFKNNGGEIENILNADKGQNSSKYNKDHSDSYESEEVQHYQNKSDRHEPSKVRHSHNTDVSCKERDINSDDMTNQKRQDKMSVHEDIDSDKDQEVQSSSIVEEDEREINGNDQNFSEDEDNTGETIENEIQKYEGQDSEKNFGQEDKEKAGSLDIKAVQTRICENELDDKEDNDNEQDGNITQNEKSRVEVNQNEYGQDQFDNEILSYINENMSNNQDHLSEENISHKTPQNIGVNVTQESTRRYGKKQETKVPSPEVILDGKLSQMDSFSVQRRNTSVRKTKSIIKNLTIKPSPASVNESTHFPNASRNSRAEESGWDSHGITRATLRQTLGKDFTPRKSLRALVMEKSAKRRTNFTDINVDISRFPLANSTELIGSVPFAANQSNVNDKNNESKHEVSRENSNNTHTVDQSGDAQELNRSHQVMSRDFDEPNDAKKIPKSNHDSSRYEENADIAQEINKSDDAREMSESNQEVSRDINDYNEEQESNESDQANEINEFDAEYETDEHDQVVIREIEVPDKLQKYNDSEQAEVNKELDDECEMDESNEAMSHEVDDSDDAQSNESDHTQEINDSDDAQSNESDHTQEINDCDDAQSSESDHAQEINDCDDAHISDKSEHESTPDINDDNNSEQMNEADELQLMNESAHKDSHKVDKTDEESQMDEFNNEQKISESEVPQEINAFDDTPEIEKSNNAYEMIESDHQESRKTRQTTLETYLQKIKKQNIERKKRLEDEIKNTLKAPTRDMLNPFKVPAVPKLRRMKAQQIKTKAKPVKSSVIPLNMLPVEVLEDMKYKPPKRYRPTNASWITNRLYKFLETKLEPKYDYKARVRAEKLVETIYNFTKEIRRHDTAPPPAVDALKHEMARLDVVKTHFEFYEFFHEYMPRDVRVKVVPDVLNKISLPKYGVFSDILR